MTILTKTITLTQGKHAIILGLFDNEDDAATTYNMAALRNFREYAKLNMIGGLCAN